MPLPIRDGNQSLTTLSTLIVNSAHVPAHTVVSLGSQAITDIAQAVSGVELGPNTLNALENITVTLGQVTITGGLTDAQLRASAVTIGGSVQVSNFPATQSVTFSNPTITGSVSVLNLPSTQTIAGTVTATLNLSNLADGQAIGIPLQYNNTGDSDGATVVNLYKAPASNTGGLPIQNTKNSVDDSIIPLAISGTVTVGNSVTIGSLPAISGTVTANGGDFAKAPQAETSGPEKAIRLGFADDESWRAVGLASGGSPLPTQLFDNSGEPAGIAMIGGSGHLKVAVGNSVTANFNDPDGIIAGPLNIEGGSPQLGLNIGFSEYGDATFFRHVSNLDPFPVKLNTPITIGSLPAISGTVTAAAPNGSLTTRFGTPTTASVAFATSCVTNANRKYLLIQNVTTGSNVITVGIGFTPTTTQGIQLTAGAGITFESSYIPTGAVYVLSSVTASNFTILEA